MRQVRRGAQTAGWISAAGCTLFLAACGASTVPVGEATSAASVSPAPSSPSPVAAWSTYELLPGVSVDVPSSWHSADYLATPATVYFPIRFFSTADFGERCPGHPDEQSCMDQTWFAPGWSTPADGVLLLWSSAQLPPDGGTPLGHEKGDRTQIGGHAATVWKGQASAGCANGAATELDAAVITHTDESSGEHIDVIACFGPDAPAQVRADVDAMVRSLHFTG